MSRTFARRLTRRLMNRSWVERTRYRFAVGPEYLWLDPGDIVKVAADNATHLVRLDKVEFGAPGLVLAEGVAQRITLLPFLDEVADDLDAAPIYEEGEEEPPPDEIPAPDARARSPTRASCSWTCPSSSTSTTTPVSTTRCAGYAAGWHGAVLYKSTDSGATYAALDGMTSAAAIGSATTVLASGPDDHLGPWLDRERVPDPGHARERHRGERARRHQHGGLRGTRALGGPAVADRDPGERRHLHALEPPPGTQGHRACGGQPRDRRHVRRPDERPPSTGPRCSRASSALARTYKGVSIGGSFAEASSQAFTNAGVGLECYSVPRTLHAVDNGDGTYDVAWLRRTRAQGEWRDLVDVPLFEDSESYSVEVLDGVTPVSTAIVSVQEATVTASPGYTVKVAQRSALAGTGYYSEITL